MSQAYRSSADGEEEKYQQALSAYRERVHHAQGLSWVYTQRKAQRLAGLLASWLALLGYPVVFVSLLFGLLKSTNPSMTDLAWHWWPQGAASLSALVPLVIYSLVYQLMRRREPTQLQHLFEVPRRVASTPESTLYLQQQDPLQKLREECAKLAPGSVSWASAAVVLFSTQLPILLLLVLGAVFKLYHAAALEHCWLDGVAGVFFVGCFTFFGFYPFLISSWRTARYADDKNFPTPLLSVDLDDLNPSFSLAVLLSIVELFFVVPLVIGPSLAPALRGCVLLGGLLAPVLFVILLGIKLAPWRLRRLYAAFAREHAALYPSDR